MTVERVFMLTGVTTSLGRDVARKLARRGRVVGVRAPHEPAPAIDAPLSCVADLSRSDEVRKVIAGFAAEMHVDTIVCLGSESARSGPKGISHAVSTRLLLDAAERVASVRSFIVRSTATLYRANNDDPVIVNERQPLDFSPRLTPRQRDWLEADVMASQRTAAPSMRVAVLRLSEVLAAGLGSTLLDYLRLPIRLRPMGFDPIINVLSLEDAAEAFALAAENTPRGIFNVPGADSLPLSELMHRLPGASWAVPDAFIEPLLSLRKHKDVRYGALRDLLHHGRVVDGRAAAAAFGYRPHHPIDWRTTTY